MSIINLPIGGPFVLWVMPVGTLTLMSPTMLLLSVILSIKWLKDDWNTATDSSHGIKDIEENFESDL